MKYVNRLCCAVCALVIAFSLTSCGYWGYRGERKDLYTVAVNNVFGVRGYIPNGEIYEDPAIHVIETDNFGRTLFFYSEYGAYSDSRPDYGMAFVIMQKSEGDYAYYYQDKCYVPYFDTTDDWEEISPKVDAAVLENLKAQNDWNQDFHAEKCVKVRIYDQKPEGALHLSEGDLDGLLYAYEAANGYTGTDDRLFKTGRYCETDSYGRELHYIFGSAHNKGEHGEDVYEDSEYAVIFNSDGTCSLKGIVKIPAVEDSFALINKLKQDNGWNTPG